MITFILFIQSNYSLILCEGMDKLLHNISIGLLCLYMKSFAHQFPVRIQQNSYTKSEKRAIK